MGCQRIQVPLKKLFTGEFPIDDKELLKLKKRITDDFGVALPDDIHSNDVVSPPARIHRRSSLTEQCSQEELTSYADTIKDDIKALRQEVCALSMKVHHFDKALKHLRHELEIVEASESDSTA